MFFLTSRSSRYVECMGKVEGKMMSFMFLSPWTSKPPVARGTLSPWPWSLLPFSLHLHENDFCKHLAKSGGEEGCLCGNLGCIQGTGPAFCLPWLCPRCPASYFAIVETQFLLCAAKRLPLLFTL